MTDDYTSVNGYSLFRRDCKKRKGGGVGIYVRESYRSSSFFSSDNFEVIWVKLQLHNCFLLPLATILLNRCIVPITL